jgi:hypothetical protein
LNRSYTPSPTRTPIFLSLSKSVAKKLFFSRKKCDVWGGEGDLPFFVPTKYAYGFLSHYSCWDMTPTGVQVINCTYRKWVFLSLYDMRRRAVELWPVAQLISNLGNRRKWVDIPTAPSVYRRPKCATFEVLSAVFVEHPFILGCFVWTDWSLVTDFLDEPTASSFRTMESRRQSQDCCLQWRKTTLAPLDAVCHLYEVLQETKRLRIWQIYIALLLLLTMNMAAVRSSQTPATLVPYGTLYQQT